MNHNHNLWRYSDTLSVKFEIKGDKIRRIKYQPKIHITTFSLNSCKTKAWHVQKILIQSNYISNIKAERLQEQTIASQRTQYIIVLFSSKNSQDDWILAKFISQSRL